MKPTEIAANLLFYGGLGKDEYLRVREPVAESNHKSLTHWSILVSIFWIYCLLMSLKAPDYARCRAAYAISLAACITSYFGSRFLVKRFPKTLEPVMWFFRLFLLGGGVGIALCQYDVRSLTLFAVAIMSPSIFIDNTITSLCIHLIILGVYILLGRGVIAPEVYSWGLGNFSLFSVFGLLIGNAINKDRFERYLFADSASKLADLQARYAYFDQMTGLKNRRAYSEKLSELAKQLPPVCCVIMIDINGLKQMNDTRGHDAGDELIIGTAECIREAFPDTEDAYRLGGDEFCVILAEREAYTKERLAVLFQRAAKKKGRYIDRISIACGMASNQDSLDIEQIAKTADERMYRAKKTYYMNSEHNRRHEQTQD